jgi:hypothetical protein
MARLTLLVLAFVAAAPLADAMCGYFRPIINDIKSPPVLQPSQIAFITWDPAEKMETVTVQPRFEGNAVDFGMVIPTPSQPKLHEMSRDFFKALSVATQPKKRVIPQSKLMPRAFPDGIMFGGGRAAPAGAGGGGGGAERIEDVRTTVSVVEVGQVGNLDYKIITAGRADDLYKWLKDNKYSYSGDEATLNFYVQKKYFFTVMKIDTLQMKRNKDGTYTGDVTPTRFTFTSDELVYPLKITQVSVKDKTDALFYVQAPYKVDLPGDMSYQFHWLTMLQMTNDMFGANDLLEPNRKWLEAVRTTSPDLMRRGQQLGFAFPLNQELPANKDGIRPTSLQWAKKLTADDIKILSGDMPYSETAPDPDFGFTAPDMRDPQRAVAIRKVIQARLQKAQKDRPRGYLVREAPTEDLKTMAVLKGHLREGQVLTKFHRTFTRGEMNADLVLAQAKVGQAEDRSEHEEMLRTMGFGRPGFGPGGFPGGFDVPPARPGFRELPPAK